MSGGPAWSRRRNPLQEAMERGAPAVAMWVTSPWAAVPEILGVAGIDGVILDLEHVSHDVLDAERMIMAADAAGISALVRPQAIDPPLVSRLLDAGAHGIVFPRVEDVHDARRAVACTRYPPTGLRGWGGAHTRYAMWEGGYARDLFGGSGEVGVYSAEYVRRAHEGTLVVLLVESVRGVENVDAIAATEGVDALIFGWGDFAVESGFDRERCETAAAAVREAADRHGVALGVTPRDDFRPGWFTIAGIDTLLMSAALTRAVAEARAAALAGGPA